MSIRINNDGIPNTVIEAKRWCRSAIRKALAETDESYRAAASDSICRRTTELLDELEPETVLAYYPVNREVNILPVIRELLRRGTRVCLPLCTDMTGPRREKGSVPEMEARLITDPDSLVPGAYGIPEPASGTEKIEPENIDAIILPCLACDNEGRRLGHGGGYYDRFLSLSGAECYRLAVCYDSLLVEDSLPTEEHDERMDAVVTDTAVYRFR